MSLDEKQNGDKLYSFEVNTLMKAIRDLKQNVIDLANDIQNYVIGFGEYESKSFGTVYEAETDGIVIATHVTLSNERGGFIGYTDDSNPPTTLVAQSTDSDNNTGSSITFPVVKGTYWKVVNSYGATDVRLSWVPLNRI